MKSTLVFLALTMILTSTAGAQTESSVSKTQEAALLTDLAQRDPQGYELYRQDRVNNAASYEEFLEWATPEELADDLDVESESIENLIQNAGTPTVTIKVSLKNHTMQMTTPNGTMSAGAMGGRPGFPTPRGCFTPTVLDKNHHSKKFANAPMPNSVFFRGGAALHAGDLGVPSHGCVHLDLRTSSLVFQAVAKYGRMNTQVCVQ